MSRGSDARKSRRGERRAMKAAGVAVLQRLVIEQGAMAKVVVSGANLTDFLAYNVAAALTALDEAGADMTKNIVVTIGQHPDTAPGDVTIEAKAAAARPVVDPDPGCPIDHSLDTETDE